MYRVLCNRRRSVVAQASRLQFPDWRIYVKDAGETPALHVLMRGGMWTVRYIYWQDEEMWLGYLEEFPDYMTQGESHDELQDNLRDLYHELTHGETSCVRMCGVLESEP